MATLKDIYWLAGILEGEGCFLHLVHKATTPLGVLGRSKTYAGRNSVNFSIKLHMNDRDIIERVASLWERSFDERISRGTRSYSVRISGGNAIGWMMTIYPLMGLRRKGKIKEIIHEWKVYKRAGHTLKTHCPFGHPYGVDRHCAECHRIKQREYMQQKRLKEQEITA